MNRLKIGTKIALGYAALIIILMVLVGFLSSLLFSINKNAQILSQDAMPMVNDSAGLERALLSMSLELRSYSLTEEPAYLEAARAFLPQIAALLKSMDENLATYQSPDKDEITKLVGDIKVQVKGIEALSEGMEDIMARLDGARKNFSSLRDAVFSDYLYPFFNLILDELSKTNGDDEETKERLSRYNIVSNRMWDNYEAANLTFWQGQANLSLSEISGSVELILTSASDLGSLLDESALPEETLASGRELAKKMPEVKGALESFIAVWTERDDNSRKSAELIRAISQNLTELGTRAGETSAKGADQTRHNVSSALTASFIGLGLTLIAGLACAVLIGRGVTGSIKAAISRILAGSGYVEQNAGILAEAANTLSQGASQNASSLQDISSALEELSAMTSRNSDNAGQADSLMQGARGDVNQAGGSMNSVIKAMAEISTSGQEIGNIIKTIDEIAFQTNLLALNAAVEAARAGDAGAGFAVVADEVRNLAIRSAEAAKNTAGLIDGTIRNIGVGSDLVRQTAEGFERVSQSVSQVGGLLSEVAEASQEQALGIAQITRSMTEMDRVTNDNLNAANQAAGASSELADQAEELMDTVNQLSAMVYGQGENRGGNVRG
ncbi:methyl-accepting chemotaxis protein [Deltaproteobacteria bacterium OttesenSCG-928-K17]|nr:methyl-accepting chemotaxis protein [Deltaproteobacteria bacterium OttesenSCG-928-K17]